MSLMDWDESLDIGVNDMNDQHKVLLALMNELFDLHNNGDAFQKKLSVLESLYEKTVWHFGEEEKLMDKMEYHGRGPHKLIHKSLLKDLQDHLENFKEKKEFDHMFFTFLKVWLSAHIKGVDMKYGREKQAA